MHMLDIYVFASASENGALVLYITKLIFRIQKGRKHCKYFFVFFYKNICKLDEVIPPLCKEYVQTMR